MKAWQKGIAVGIVLIAFCLQKPFQVKAETIKTIASKSYVVLNQKTNFYTQKGKKSKKKARRGQGFRVYRVRAKKHTFYQVKNHLWLLARATHGTVWYQQGKNNMMVLSTDGHGRLTYSLADLLKPSKSFVLQHNAYLYNNRGLPEQNKKGNVLWLPKGEKVSAYYQSKIAGQKFWLTDQGWLKAKNLRRLSAKRQKASKKGKKQVK